MEHYQTKYSVRYKMVLKIIIAIICLIGGGFLGLWIGGIFNNTSGNNSKSEFEDYIDFNIERLKIELESIVEKNIEDLKCLEETTEHINAETIKLEDRLERITKYKEELNETKNVIETINRNLDHFKPSD